MSPFFGWTMIRSIRPGSRDRTIPFQADGGRFPTTGAGSPRTDWSLAKFDAPLGVLARVQHHYFDAGHMMYTREADLRKFKADLAGWLAA